MPRQGKYTRRITPAQQVKRRFKQRFRWWRKLSWKKRILVVGGPILIFLILVPLLTYLYFARDISDQDRLMNRNNTGIVLYANDGKTEIYSSGRAEHRDLLPLDKISPSMKDALVASEDKNFYKHGGFSIGNTLAAVYANFVTGGNSYGGSTLTQQLAKNTLLSSDKNYLRKFQELSIAIAIEQTYSKDQILAMYLNSVYYGENAFGIQDASQTYFGITPDKLDLAQASMLVGVLPAPSAYSPISGNPEYAKERQATVLTRMVTNGKITEAEKQAAIAETLTYQAPKSPINDSVAPHFAEMVLDEVYKKYGEETVTRSGYQVITTLDANVQTQLQTAVAANMKTINNNGGSNAAAVAIDPTTGEIRGLVGSYDFNNPDFGKVNVATSLRQPGSSFKPIYYSQALANGLITPATVLQDVKTDFGGGYVPLDADKKFRGDVTVRNALDWSLNIPSVQVMQKLGINTAVSTAQRMGLSSIDSKNNYGLSLALGSAEVTPLAMTNAYAALANQGKQYTPTTIRTISTKYSDAVFQSKNSPKQVISSQGAFLVSNILSDNAARASIFGSSLNVYDAKTRAVKTVAVKTGTTNDSRDAWAIGYTPQMAIGVWVGNNDNTAMSNGGSIMAGPIFTKAMGAIMAGVDTKFPDVTGVVQRNVCTSNHGLADSAVKGSTYSEWFLSTALPTASCTVKQTPTPSVTPSPSVTPTTQPETLSVLLSASPVSTAQRNSIVTLTATLSDPDAAGIIQFKDGNTVLGNSSLINGKATTVTSFQTVGPHSIVATFTPSDSSEYDITSSPALSYTITN